MPSKSNNSQNSPVRPASSSQAVRSGGRLPGVRDVQIIRSSPNMVKENRDRAVSDKSYNSSSKK